MLRGDNIKPLADGAPPFWRLDQSGRRLVMSSNHLGPETIGDYVRALREFGCQICCTIKGPGSKSAIAVAERGTPHDRLHLHVPERQASGKGRIAIENGEHRRQIGDEEDRDQHGRHGEEIDKHQSETPVPRRIEDCADGDHHRGQDQRVRGLGKRDAEHEQTDGSDRPPRHHVPQGMDEAAAFDPQEQDQQGQDDRLAIVPVISVSPASRRSPPR